MTLPSIFISHGSPEFALAPGQLGATLRQLGQRLPRPCAVLALSPHWMAPQLEVQSGLAPATVHDFGGFSPALYDLHYPAPGAPAVAAEAIRLLAEQGLTAVANDRVGRDHGTWVPLRHLYPQADVPVLQLSLPPTDQPQTVLALGRALAPLRQQGVLLIGSGGLTHNLYDFRSTAPADYVLPFAEWVAGRIAAGDLDALLDYRAQAPDAKRAHPSNEHLLPLFFAIGAAGDDWQTSLRLPGGINDRVLAMDSFIFANDLSEFKEAA